MISKHSSVFIDKNYLTTFTAVRVRQLKFPLRKFNLR